jgi:hypothetical protein
MEVIMFKKPILSLISFLFLLGCQTGNSNLDGSFRLKAIGVTANVALERGFRFCASTGKNFEGAIEALRAAGYTIKEPKTYSSKKETAAFDPQENVNFVVIQNKIGRRICDIQFRYNSGISSLPKIGKTQNGRASWDIEPLGRKLSADIASDPSTEQITRKLARGTQTLRVYRGTQVSIDSKVFVHPDGYALGVIKVLAPL